MPLPLASQDLLERIDKAAQERNSNKLTLHLQAAIAEDHQDLFDELMKRPLVADTAFILDHVDATQTKGGWVVSLKGTTS